MSKSRFILFILGFFALWAGAWVLHQALVDQARLWSTTQVGRDTVYWLAMKLIMWIGWPVVLFRGRLGTMTDVLGFSRADARRGLRWGGIAAVVWIVLSISIGRMTGQYFHPASYWWLVGYTAIITPFIEEVMFRGFILRGLQALGLDGRPANGMTTVLFFFVHCLGWAFQGVLFHNLTSTVWISIVLLSLVLGFIRIHSKSIWSSIILHLVNNVLAAFVA